MNKYGICILYCYFTRFPDGQRREKQRGGKKGGKGDLSNFTYSRNQWWEKRRGAQCLNLSIREEHVVSDQPQSDWREETGGRESRGPRED